MKQRLVKLDVLICVYQCLSTNFIPSPYEISPCWSPIHGYIQYIQHTKQQRFCGFHLRGKGVFGSQGAPQVGPNGSRSPLPSAPSWNLHGGWGSGSRLERVNVSYVGYLIGIIKWTKQPLYVLCFVLLVSLHFFTYYIYIYIYIHTITQVIFQFNMQAPPFSAFEINGHIFRILPGILNCFFQAFLERPRSSRLENDRKTIATEVEGPWVQGEKKEVITTFGDAQLSLKNIPLLMAV